MVFRAMRTRGKIDVVYQWIIDMMSDEVCIDVGDVCRSRFTNVDPAGQLRGKNSCFAK